MTEPMAPCKDLTAITRIYPEDKRLTVHVPASAFDQPVAPGAEVTVVGAMGYGGKPLNGTPRVRGRVKRMVVEIEIDLATLEEPQHEGQGTLG